MSFGGTGMSVTTIELPEKEYSCGIEIDPSTGNYVIMTERTIEDYSNPDNYSYEIELHNSLILLLFTAQI